MAIDATLLVHNIGARNANKNFALNRLDIVFAHLLRRVDELLPCVLLIGVQNAILAIRPGVRRVQADKNTLLRKSFAQVVEKGGGRRNGADRFFMIDAGLQARLQSLGDHEVRVVASHRLHLRDRAIAVLRSMLEKEGAHERRSCDNDDNDHHHRDQRDGQHHLPLDPQSAATMLLHLLGMRTRGAHRIFGRIIEQIFGYRFVGRRGVGHSLCCWRWLLALAVGVFCWRFLLAVGVFCWLLAVGVGVFCWRWRLLFSLFFSPFRLFAFSLFRFFALQDLQESYHDDSEAIIAQKRILARKFL